MSSGQSSSLGFTIIETMIFLAVTAFLILGALLLVAGSQNKTEFNQAINDVNQQIQTVVKNVGNGYYANVNNFTSSNQCSEDAVTNSPTFTAISGAQGTNSPCIFMGQVIQFTNDNSGAYYVYSVVGNRETSSHQEATTMAQANPLLIEPGSGAPPVDTHAFPSATQNLNLEYGLTVHSITNDKAAVGLFTTLGSANASQNSLNSGGLQLDFVSLGTGLGADSSTIKRDFADDFDAHFLSRDYSTAANIDPSSGVSICFDSGGTNESGVITIGGSNNHDATSLQINQVPCP